MARLTLSEQVSTQAAKIEELTAELHATNARADSLQVSQTLHLEEISRLRTQLGGLEILRKELEEVTKDRDSKKFSYEYRDKAADKAENELEQAHAVLDGVEGAPAREYEMEYGKGKRNVVTRLAGAFLAIAKNSQGK